MIEEIYINRYYGLGDVLMALGAAHALKAYGKEVTFITNPMYHGLIKACPHVKEVVSQHPKGINLNDARFGVANLHQTDAYLDYLGYKNVPASYKTIDLNIGDTLSEEYKNKNWVVLHPSTGDSNRTWPREKWVDLAYQLKMKGHNVITIGSSKDENKKAYRIPNIPSFFNQSYFDVIQLLRHSKALVSCDSGPIQLAGASNCDIIGIYTVVKGTRRLPYRTSGKSYIISPTCVHYPCYSKMWDAPTWMTYGKAKLDSGESLNDVFSKWCLCQNKYSCLSEISVNQILEVI
jgi:ADP-heptose:LPS heptosyltransferase